MTFIFHIHGYNPRSQRSSWHIVGVQYLFVKWINESMVCENGGQGQVRHALLQKTRGDSALKNVQTIFFTQRTREREVFSGGRNGNERIALFLRCYFKTRTGLTAKEKGPAKKHRGCALESPRSLFKHRLLGCTSRISDMMVQGVTATCISSQLPGNSSAAGTGSTP